MNTRSVPYPALLRLAAPLLALMLVSALVITTSRAAFSDTTSNAGNNWAAGTVTITDDDGDSAMFSVSDMKPGQTETRCIEVTYEGSLVPADVSLYGTSGGTGLDAYLDVDIDIGTGATFGDCGSFGKDADIFNGTLASFSGTHSDFASGLLSWSPVATNEAKSYRFIVTLQDNNSAQGLDATATFTWEAQNQ